MDLAVRALVLSVDVYAGMTGVLQNLLRLGAFHGAELE